MAFHYAESSLRHSLQNGYSKYAGIVGAFAESSRRLLGAHGLRNNLEIDIPLPSSEDANRYLIISTFGQAETFRILALQQWQENLVAQGLPKEEVQVRVGEFRRINQQLSDIVEEGFTRENLLDIKPSTLVDSDIDHILRVYQPTSWLDFIKTLRTSQGLYRKVVAERAGMHKGSVQSFELHATEHTSMVTVSTYLRGLQVPIHSAFTSALCAKMADDIWCKRYPQVQLKGERPSYAQVERELAFLKTEGIHTFQDYVRYIQKRTLRDPQCQPPAHSPGTWKPYLSLEDLAKEARVSTRIMYKIISQNQAPTVQMTYLIMFALGLHPNSKESLCAGLLALENR